ncbi:GyrI-like domain-containing protein [Humisphaera borealis]|uniref:GyrI-like domain-containing protein n=1 Tax=Humisphaera borealis TaxID=2807512 RepID=A0A7M2X2G9_9BACT|nr:GyrI-like domain-containing protein [Humisphaera borealis]QOV91966.1 GyrI-like domain-containing protein [Humisphaera borealis]
MVPLTKPVLPPLTQPAYSLSNFAEQALPAQQAFASVTRQTTLREVRRTIDGAMKALSKDQGLGQHIIGPSMLIYTGMSGSLDEVFTLEVGFPVRPDYQPAEGVQVRPLPAMKCLSVDFVGSMRSIDKAYDKLIPAAQARKLKRTGEVREIYYRWNGHDSEENQLLVAVGVE